MLSVVSQGYILGTFVIQLPSNYDGVRLNIYHKEKECEFCNGGAAVFKQLLHHGFVC